MVISYNVWNAGRSKIAESTKTQRVKLLQQPYQEAELRLSSFFDF